MICTHRQTLFLLSYQRKRMGRHVERMGKRRGEYRNFIFMLPCIVIDLFLSRVRMELSSILTLLGNGHQKTCMQITSAECTVENS